MKENEWYFVVVLFHPLVLSVFPFALNRSFHLYFWEVERAPEIEMKRRGKDIPGIHPSVVSLDY